MTAGHSPSTRSRDCLATYKPEPDPQTEVARRRSGRKREGRFRIDGGQRRRHEISAELSPTGGFWIMMWDQWPDPTGKGSSTKGIFFSWSFYPWGEWAAPVEVFSTSDHLAPNGMPFVYDKVAAPQLLGPALPGAANTTHPGAPYGPMIVESSCGFRPNPNGSGWQMVVYWTLCTDRPYYAVLMMTAIDMA